MRDVTVCRLVLPQSLRHFHKHAGQPAYTSISISVGFLKAANWVGSVYMLLKAVLLHARIHTKNSTTAFCAASCATERTAAPEQHTNTPDCEVFPVAVMCPSFKGKGWHPNGVGPIEGIEGKIVDLYCFYTRFLVQNLFDNHIQRHLIQLTLQNQHIAIATSICSLQFARMQVSMQSRLTNADMRYRRLCAQSLKTLILLVLHKPASR